MNCTVINGEFYDFLLDISSLAADEVAAVLDYLEKGQLDEKYHTPKILSLIKDTNIRALKALVAFCIDDGKYDHLYTTKLLFDMLRFDLCSKEDYIKEVSELNRLFTEYQEGVKSAAQRIMQNLFTFFAQTPPFTFYVVFTTINR